MCKQTSRFDTLSLLRFTIDAPFFLFGRKNPFSLKIDMKNTVLQAAFLSGYCVTVSINSTTHYKDANLRHT